MSEANQTVEVQAGAELLQTQTALVGQDIDTKTVSTLPLNGRDYTQLVTLGAGATPNGYSRAKNGFSLNGSQTFQNTMLLDGIDNNNYILGNDTGNINHAITLVGWAVSIAMRMRYEEAILTQAFPDYVEYRRRVGALLPWPTSPSARRTAPASS